MLEFIQDFLNAACMHGLRADAKPAHKHIQNEYQFSVMYRDGRYVPNPEYRPLNKGIFNSLLIQACKN